MRMQTKSYAPLLSFSAESIAISRYSLAMLASSSRAPSLLRQLGDVRRNGSTAHPGSVTDG
jgi:hypothetical protein